MLFAYNEDGRLEVVADQDEARRSFEADDVATGAIQLFDSAGRPLTPDFPHRTEKRVLGIRVSEDRGPFELAPADDATETLETVLGPTVVLMPNRWFPNLDAVRAHLSAQR